MMSRIIFYSTTKKKSFFYKSVFMVFKMQMIQNIHLIKKKLTKLW